MPFDVSSLLTKNSVNAIAFTHTMFTSSEREQIEGPCLIWRAHVMNENLYWCWPLDLSLNPMQSFVDMLSNWYEYKLRRNLLLADGRNSREKDKAFVPPAPDEPGMGEMFLLKDTQQNLQKMVDRNIKMDQVRPLIAPMPKVSRLRVTSDFRIILTDYEDVEIEMPPLRKAMYLVYLRHPEGINLKCLSDYKDELYHFYEEISRRSKNNPNKLVKWARLERLIDPTDQSSINNLSKIKASFQLHDEVSDLVLPYYCIAGNQGDVKKITLDRSLVTFEVTSV